MGVLVIAEHDNAGLKPATLNTLTAAGELGGEVDMLVARADCADAAAAATKPPRLAHVLVAAAPAYRHRPENRRGGQHCKPAGPPHP